MDKKEFRKTIEKIVSQDPRYAVGAYVFVRMALDFSVRKFCSDSTKHVSTSELLEGIKLFALETFGPMAKILFDEWGVHDCSDFGAIVFNLIDAGELRKNDDDKIEDFSKNAYDFYDAFVKPFKPKRKKA